MVQLVSFTSYTKC